VSGQKGCPDQSVFYSICFCHQALPIFLDALLEAWGAVLISVTLILMFGEVNNILFCALDTAIYLNLQKPLSTCSLVHTCSALDPHDTVTLLNQFYKITPFLPYLFQILPQAVCSRHGLAVGAAMAPVVRILLVVFFPVSYPISKVLSVPTFSLLNAQPYSHNYFGGHVES